jgi:serine/threonine-protein kinase
MVGAYGEVLVMDWGVAMLTTADRRRATEGRVVLGGGAEASQTHTAIAGTPAYMPPEQLQARFSQMGPPTDVYALGVVLYEILTGRRPYVGDPRTLLEQAQAGNVPRLNLPPGSSVDEALEAILVRAMAADPKQRYPDAGALAADIARWREGSLRRERALAVVREAEAILPEIAPKRERARQLRERAAQERARTGPRADMGAYVSAWQLEDEAANLEREASVRTIEVVQKLHGALAHAPDLVEANDLLARIHHQEHREAEHRRDAEQAERHELLLRAHDVGRHADYLAGVTTLTLHTEPPCHVRLCRLEVRDRRLRAVEVADLGTTPLREVELRVGSWLLELDAGDRPVVRYPVHLERSHPWDGVAPGETDPRPIPLPAQGEVGDGEVYVPAGWCRVGGDPRAPGAGVPRQVWVDGFVISRRPVTAAEMFAFLARPAAVAERRQVLRASVGAMRPSWPATGASWTTALACARWLGQRDGHVARIPTEAEWEKAARACGGWFFPWGDTFEPVFAHVRAGAREPTSPRSVDGSPDDVSIHGVSGLAGNVRDWCMDPFVPGGAPSMAGARACEIDPSVHAASRAVRGGSWRLGEDAARAAARAGLPADVGHRDVGFRIVRTWPIP